MRLAWLRARCFVHATEDEDRVREALLRTAGVTDPTRAAKKLQRQKAKGHHGNPIVLLELDLRAKREVEAALDTILADPDRAAAIRDSLRLRVDEDNVLHVRLDKQAAVVGRLEVGEGSDAIVVRIKGVAEKTENAARAWARRVAAPRADASSRRAP